MSVRERGCFATTWSNSGTTLGSNLLFVSAIVSGSAANGQVQILDGTKTIANMNVVSVTGLAFYSPAYPIALNSALITVVTSTAGYSIVYMPRP